MNQRLLTISTLLLLSVLLSAQVPFAFRYQASLRDKFNEPVNNEVTFDIKLFADNNAVDEIYSETHITEPDTNGLVAFSIGNGATNDDFSSITWAEGPYYIQVLLDNEEISYSQLVSVPYAMHAQTATELHNLQSPTETNDPATKGYVDSLSLAPKDLETSSSGDTLTIGNTQIVIPGMSSNNADKYESQLVLGGSYNECLISTLQCNDGGFILLGMTQSGNGDVSDFKGDADIWVIKLSKELDIAWSKTLGGSSYDNAKLIIEEEDGYLVGGTTESNDGDVTSNNGEFDIWLVKLNLDGTMAWQNNYGGAGTEFLNDIIPLEEGGYIIGATTFSNGDDILWLNGECDIWIFELNISHSIINSKTFGGTKYDALLSMELNSDNSINLYGTSSSNDGEIVENNGSLDFVTIQVDRDLELIEQECYGESINEQLTYASSTLLAGNSFAENWSIGTGNEYKNIRIENISDSPWSKQLGGSNNDVFIDIVTKNDTIIILGQSASFDGDITNSNGGQDLWLIELLPNGDISKNTTLGGTYDESPKVIKPLSNGGWIIGGEAESSDGDLTLNAGQKDIWLIKTDKDFNIIWQESYGGSYTEILQDLFIINDSEFVICGSTSSNDYSITGLHDKAGESSDIWVLKVNAE